MSSSNSPVPSAPAPKPWYRSTTVVDLAALALRGRAKATQPVSLNFDVGKLLGVSAVAVLALVFSGCQALGLRTGTDPSAQAPAYSGVGVLVLGAGNDLQRAVSGVRLDQSGATGASGQASATAEQSQTTEIGAEAVSALLDAAQAALAGGNPAAAEGILGAARKLSGTKNDKSRSAGAASSTKDALAAAAAKAIVTTTPTEASATPAVAPAKPLPAEAIAPAPATGDNPSAPGAPSR